MAGPFHCVPSSKKILPFNRLLSSSCLLGSEKLAILYEQWVSCEGFWKESSLYKELKVKTHHRRLGRRVWLTFAEISKKYSSDRVATRIVEAKRSDPTICKTQIRDHPDCPGDSDSSLKCANLFYLIALTIYSKLS